MLLRVVKALLAMVLLIGVLTVAVTEQGVGAASLPTPKAAASGPQCTFNGSSLPLITGVSSGSKIAISCTGMPALHPYLVIGTSLLLAIDPAAKPLLTGQVASAAALGALLATLKEVDLASEALPVSNLSGNLSFTWTVPAFQPLDPNASCPPSQKEFNSGMIGCAVAMIDLTSFKPVAAGSAVFEYSGFPLLPPNPTVSLSASTAVPNQSISVTDAPAATTYWWVSTLAELQAGLGGGSSSAPSVTVTLVSPKGTSTTVGSSIHVAPATYDGTTFFPPVLSGAFAVPSTVSGPQSVNLQVGTLLEGLPLSNNASASLFVNNPPTTSIVVPTNKERLSASTYLDASATNATSVQFVLFGGPYFAQVIGTAVPTPWGWLYDWDTTSVPNGSYLLFSQASNASGSGISPPVKISVHNRQVRAPK